MRIKLFIFVLSILSFLYSEGYNMQLLSFLPYEQNCSDITGFYQDDREFAVIGLQNAASFIDITDPYNPIELGRIDGSVSIWRDLKYWDRHVYIGTEANDGIKIVSVDDPDNPVLVNTIQDVDNSHNIHVDNDGYLYVVGADEYDVWIYSLEDPSNPNLIGTWTEEYCHDIEVYNNKLYCAAIYSGNFYIVDVSDKSNPITLAQHFTGTDGISTHDVAVTEDEHYLFTGDENLGGHVKVWDISDYGNINLVDEYQTPNGEEHTSHNLYVRPGTNYLIISYYADGTRIVDISDPTNLQEIAYYDMSDVEGLYVSNWGTYAYLPSGNIISSDIEQGLFVLKLGGVSILHEALTDMEYLDGPLQISAVVESFEGEVSEVELHYKFYYGANSQWVSTDMLNTQGNLYEAMIEPLQDGTLIYYYITAENNQGDFITYPENIDNPVQFTFGTLPVIYSETFEDSNGDFTVSGNASSGIWEWGNPNPTIDNGSQAQTGDDHTDDGENCWVTGNAPGENSPGQDDVDGGYTTLVSQQFDLSLYEDVLITYWRWYTNNIGNNPGSDIWETGIYASDSSQHLLELTNNSNNQWIKQQFLLSEYLENSGLNSSINFYFKAEDIFNEGDTGSGGSLVEAAIDDFKLEAIGYFDVVGDINIDGLINVLDVVYLVNIILDISDDTSLADINFDGNIDVVDVVLLVNIILG